MTHRLPSTLRARFTVVMALLCLAVTLHAQTPDWKTYSYPADGFSASFPSAPEMTKKAVDTKVGPVELRSYIVTEGDTALFVGIADYRPQDITRTPDELLQGAKNGALQNAKAHLLSEAKITLGIYQGLEFESESDEAHFSARIYFVGHSLYQTLVAIPLGQPYANTGRFLDSFQIIARTTE